MTQAFNDQANFWDKDKPKTMGDFIGRPAAIQLLGNINGKKVLDAGCGTGYVSRQLALQGAIVTAIDRSVEMLARAREREQNSPLGIKYLEQSLSQPLDLDNHFDKIISISVLPYMSTLTAEYFLSECNRVLKDNGEMVLSVPHPFIFTPQSPARRPGPNWIKVKPKETRLGGYDQVQVFDMKYYDTRGKIFRSDIHHRTIGRLLSLFSDSGLKLKSVQEPVVFREFLKYPRWGVEDSYPAYFQAVLTKGERT